MKIHSGFGFVMAIALLLAPGCVSTYIRGATKKAGIATVEILSEPAGANIEVDGDYVGKAPCTVNVATNRHGFLLRTTTFRALPTIAGHYTQSKIVHGGSEYSDGNDVLPKRILFDMNLGPIRPAVDVNIDKR